jgi:hypothetical protein
MLIRPLLVVAAITGILSAPAVAFGASAAQQGNACLSTELVVTSEGGTAPGENTVTATVVAMAPLGQRISRLHLELEVQERTATAWVPFVTDQHAETYTNYIGDRLHRMWTLREDSQPIFALLDDHVQMRVYAGFHGTCGGGALIGPPLLFGLSVPTMMVVEPT